MTFGAYVKVALPTLCDSTLSLLFVQTLHMMRDRSTFL